MKIPALLCTWLLCSLALACSDNGRTGSLVSGNGGTGGSGTGSGGRGGQAAGGNAGAPDEEAGAAGLGEGGAGGEMPMPETPYAVYPRELQVDVGCGMQMGDAMLLIQNQGAMPLVISNATPSTGYTVSGSFPLTIASGAGAALAVTAPAPAANASAGDESEGTLTFTTNEPGTPSRQVKLKTTLYGAKISFTDSDGEALGATLTLPYADSAVCPSDKTYRVQNSGNVAFTLVGPTFPAHFGGRSTGASGASIAPGDFTELKVGGVSDPGAACSATGELVFTAQGAFCGAAPKLSVVWPSNGGSNCACTASTQ